MRSRKYTESRAATTAAQNHPIATYAFFSNIRTCDHVELEMIG